MKLLIQITTETNELQHAAALKKQLENKVDDIQSIELQTNEAQTGEMGLTILAAIILILREAKEPLVELIKQIGQYANTHPTTTIKLTLEGKGTLEVSSNAKNNSAEELAQKLLDGMNQIPLNETND